MDAHQEVFTDGLGTVQGITAIYHRFRSRCHTALPQSQASPIYAKGERGMRAEAPAGARCDRANEFSHWAAPVVPVNGDGNVCLCGDYKDTMNKAAKHSHYLIPRSENLCSSLPGGKEFTKLDLSQQVKLGDISREYVMIN